MALVRFNLKTQFGIKDDGRDYTEELQAAADLAYKYIEKNHDQAVIPLPGHRIRHSQPWRVRGNQGAAPWIYGSYGDGYSIPGTSLDWAGAPDGLQIYFEGFNRGRFWDVAVDGQDVAGRNIQVGGTAFDNLAIPVATNGFSFRRVRLSRVRPGTDGNGCLAIGTDPALVGGATLQVSGWSLRDMVFMPERDGAPGFSMGGMKAFAFKTMAAGNVKSGEIHNAEVTTAGCAFDWGNSSGFLTMSNLNIGDCLSAFRSNSGHLRVIGADIECGHVPDFRLLTGTAQIGASASLEDMEVAWNTSEEIAPVLASYAGALRLARNDFRCGEYRPFKLYHPALVAGTHGSFVSEQNWYAGCGADRPYVPLYDYPGGNDMAPLPNTYAGVNWVNAKSWGDTGGEANFDDRLHLRAFDSTTQGTPP